MNNKLSLNFSNALFILVLLTVLAVFAYAIYSGNDVSEQPPSEDTVTPTVDKTAKAATDTTQAMEAMAATQAAEAIASAQTAEAVAATQAAEAIASAQAAEAVAATQAAEAIADAQVAEAEAGTSEAEAINVAQTLEAIASTQTAEALATSQAVEAAVAAQTATAIAATQTAETFVPVPTETPTPTVVPLLPPVTLDDQSPEMDRSRLPADSYRLLRWRPWPNDEQQVDEVPEGWYYVISFVPAEDKNHVIISTTISPQGEAIKGQKDNTGWLVYSFDINLLPDKRESCYPYWDVIVGIDIERVNCPVERIEGRTCRLTKYSTQNFLATERPGTCGRYGPTIGIGNTREGRDE